MSFLLNAKPVDALAIIVHRSSQDAIARQWVKKLRTRIGFQTLDLRNSSSILTDKVIPRQMFEVPIQAAIGKKILARETLSALRADVTAGLYGGDTRLAPPPCSLLTEV